MDSRRVARRVFVLLAALFFTGAAPYPRNPTPVLDSRYDWLQFDAASVDGVTPRSTISARNVKQLAVAWQAILPEASDCSPIYVTNVETQSGPSDLVIVSTITGRLVAIGAHTGMRVWQTTPPEGPRWTTSSPAVDPDRHYVFAYTLDGSVHRYEIGTGREATGGGWPELITLKGDVEKGSSNIAIDRTRDGHTYLYMTTAGYPDPGDEGDYQGHLVTIDLDSGQQHVFNALCSERDMHFTNRGDASDCTSVQAGIWARAGAVYDPQTDRLFVTTGNGPYSGDHGGFDWGTSVVVLRPDGTTDSGTPLDSYTPEDHQALTDEDLDLSSTTIEPLPAGSADGWPRLGVQSGKDGRLRLLNLEDLSGQGGPRHLGGALQIVDLPIGQYVLTQPAAWYDPSTKRTWVFVANNHGIAAYELVSADGSPQLVLRWNRSTGGTTPIIINRVLYLASPHQFVAMRPTTGAILWRDTTIGDIHWQSPIIVNDTVYLVDNGGYVTAYSFTGDPRESPAPPNTSREQ